MFTLPGALKSADAPVPMLIAGAFCFCFLLLLGKEEEERNSEMGHLPLIFFLAACLLQIIKPKTCKSGLRGGGWGISGEITQASASTRRAHFGYISKPVQLAQHGFSVRVICVY